LRAGPLSDGRVINTLNRNFVCVYTSNEDYSGPDPPVGAEERAELERIRNEGLARKLAVGSVRSYVLTPDGHTYVTVPTHTPDATLAMLGQAVDQFKPQAGGPVVPPRPQSAPPPAPPDAVALHLIARGDDRGSWGYIPAENWIVLTREDWLKLTPTGDVTPGQTWELGRDVIVRIFNYFYPQMENNYPSIDRIQQYGLTAKALTIKDGVVTARVDGFVKMTQSFYPASTGRNDPAPLWAAVVGVLTFAPGKPPTLQLATTRAIAGTRPFNVIVQSVPQVAR
jgi:hypothetical protein